MDCGGCTLCCLVLPVPWFDKKPGVLCKNCEAGVGCKIWDSSPDECKKFSCAYNQMPKAAIDLRPDKCNVVFERLDKNIMLGTMHPNHNGAYKSPIIQGQTQRFLVDGFSVVFNSFTLNKPIIFTAEGKTKMEVYEDLKEERNVWQLQHTALT